MAGHGVFSEEKTWKVARLPPNKKSMQKHVFSMACAILFMPFV